jgi:C4-type Zn-finger protein
MNSHTPTMYTQCPLCREEYEFQFMQNSIKLTKQTRIYHSQVLEMSNICDTCFNRFTYLISDIQKKDNS